MAIYVADPQRYERMKYNRSGRWAQAAGDSLGLWHNFGGVDSLENMRAITRRCLQSGIAHFDLAND